MQIEKITFNCKEASRYLGLSVNTFVGLLRSGKIPFIRIGRRVLIPKQALDQFINDAIPSNHEI